MVAGLTVLDDRIPYQQPPGALTVSTLAGPPQQTQVSDAQGVLATLTVGARTVAMRGATRVFTEQARPHTDAFQRTTSNGWGVSPAGGNWSNANGVDGDYSVTPGTGLINMSVTNSSRHTSLINALTDFDARLSWTMDKAPAGNAASLALSFAYTSSSNQYRARLSVLSTGSIQIVLEKELAGTVTTLGAAVTLGSGWVAGDVWHIRAQRTGTTLRCRSWKDGTTEPSTWTFTVTDGDIGAGRIGVRALATTGNTSIPFNFQVKDVQLYSGTWADPPTITHNTWVRVLAQPFDGTWTSALTAQIRAWAADTRPDALAYAMMYITGAPAVANPALGGAQIAGQTLYGPIAADGTRIEGADFHDYMGKNWTFPNGETQNAAAAELGCLDCSGYVRMVYGYHMGIPMVRNLNVDGSNLPRQTKDIGPSGPGIIVAQSASSAPPLTAMQIGDVPLFDADTSDPVAGQLDHNGIYLGVDAAGHPRFINSRKTPNGATFADLGGSSALDGTGLYATSLRLIRRF